MKTRITVPDRLGMDQTITAHREPGDGSYSLTIADAEIVLTNEHAIRLLEAMAREEAVAREKENMPRTQNTASLR